MRRLRVGELLLFPPQTPHLEYCQLYLCREVNWYYCVVAALSTIGLSEVPLYPQLYYHSELERWQLEERCAVVRPTFALYVAA